MLASLEVTRSLDEEKVTLLKSEFWMLQLRQYFKSIYPRNRSADKYSDENKKAMQKIQYKVKLSL